jgi:hypothetical protein
VDDYENALSIMKLYLSSFIFSMLPTQFSTPTTFDKTKYLFLIISIIFTKIATDLQINDPTDPEVTSPPPDGTLSPPSKSAWMSHTLPGVRTRQKDVDVTEHKKAGKRSGRKQRSGSRKNSKNSKNRKK